MDMNKLHCFFSALLQSCCVWQELMDLEKDAVVEAPGSGNSRPGGDRICSASCLTILPAAQHRAISFAEHIPVL